VIEPESEEYTENVVPFRMVQTVPPPPVSAGPFGLTIGGLRPGGVDGTLIVNWSYWTPGSAHQSVATYVPGVSIALASPYQPPWLETLSSAAGATKPCETAALWPPPQEGCWP
jgi:hypothetical protein